MSRGGTLILVDDDRDFLEMNASILSAKGFAVKCFTEPNEALAFMAGEPRGSVRLVITDLMMKALDSGFSFARAIKSDPRFAGTAVIIVTAVGSQKGFDFHPRGAEDLAAMHADAFFDKPVVPEALIGKVEELLG
jgi:CheY-like chemotaxis protein